MMLSRGMVLAAGLGLRMRPLTEHVPKPLIDVAGKKLIDYSLDTLAEAGVGHAVVNISYRAEMIKAHVAARKTPAIALSYEEGAPLETGGGIAKALPLLGNDPFFSMNSDAITINGAHALQRLTQEWNEYIPFRHPGLVPGYQELGMPPKIPAQGRDDINSLLALLLLVPVEKAHGYEGKGDFFVDNKRRIRRRKENESAPYVFTGVQILSPALFGDAPQGAFSLNMLYNRHVTEGGWFNNICAVIHEDAWLHVGDPAGLKAAEDVLAK